MLAVFRLVGQLNDWAFERGSKEEMRTDASVDLCGKIAVDLLMADRLPVSVPFRFFSCPIAPRSPPCRLLHLALFERIIAVIYAEFRK
jgi:hypothetical protein